jgi:hypothetical protein
LLLQFPVGGEVWRGAQIPERFRQIAQKFGKMSGAVVPFLTRQLKQGCQIFIGETYQIGKNIPDDLKIYQMTQIYAKLLTHQNGHT